MAVYTKATECPFGEWTSVCELRPTRESLILSMLGGVVILSPLPTLPLVSNAFGTMPAGFFASIDTGNGPSEFRLSKKFDGEMVEQEWFAWPVPGSGGGGVSAATFTAGAPAAAPSYTITLPAGVTGLVLLWEASLKAGAGVHSTVATTGTGTPVGIKGTAVTNGITNAYPTLWSWLADGSGETITVTGNAVTAYLFSWAIVASPPKPDVSSVTVQSGVGWTIAFGPLGSAAEWIVTAALIGSNSNDFEAGFFTAGNLGEPPTGLYSDGTTNWYAQAAASVAGASGGVVPIIWGQTFGASAVTASVVCASWLSGSAQEAVVTASEAFAVVDHPPPPKYLTVQLPQLSSEAMAELQRLQALLTPASVQATTPELTEG